MRRPFSPNIARNRKRPLESSITINANEYNIKKHKESEKEILSESGS